MDDTPVVQISEGILKGTSLNDSNGQEFYAFFNIPYGKPPVGDLRFQAPQPVDQWEGIKDVSKPGNNCPQTGKKPDGTVGPLGSEDCLNLNVFTKKLPSKGQKLKPVMVWIHGGGFVGGSNSIDFSGPDYLITEDIVLVTINYRIGLLGFLSLQDESLQVPGNAGLKDQVQALKWVQKNIKKFNGDPDNVTIFGSSAGSASVEFLLLTPLAKNLFHKAIMMSGSTLNPWVKSRFDPFHFIKYLGYSNKNEKEILQILREIPALKLFDVQETYQYETYCDHFGLVGTVIEKPNPTAFITKHPIDIIQSGDYNSVPVIIGYCDNEGLINKGMAAIIKTYGLKEIKINETINNWLPPETNFEDTEQVKNMTNKLTEFYNKSEYKWNEQLIIGDGMFISGILTSAINQAKFSKNPVYLYRFSYVGGLNFIKQITQWSETGASHGDDLGYFWKMKTTPNEIAESDKLMSHRLIKMWTNFAKYSNPTPPGNDLNIIWKPIQRDHFYYLSIGNKFELCEDPDTDRFKVWKEIYKMNNVTAKFL